MHHFLRKRLIELQHAFNDGGEDLLLDIDGIISRMRCTILFSLSEIGKYMNFRSLIMV